MSNQKNYNRIILFVSAALIVVSSAVGYLFVQPAMAQNVTEQAGQAMPLLWQGQISSKPSEVPGREGAQSAVIVSPRGDNALLSGILTYQASRPVSLVVWNNVELGNTSAIPEEFGDLGDIVKLDGKSIALTEIGSGTSGSVPFTGNAIELVGEEDPFIVTYSLDAKPARADIVSDIQSLKSFNATAFEAQQGGAGD
jgi:hypothetical protein